MTYTKRYDNGLRLVVEKMEGLFSVSVGVLVKTGSANESQAENGISHFIEHTVFKGTSKRSSYEISDYIDRIGASINAFTSKEITCYYTKSTYEHVEETIEVLSDLFFNATFNKQELEKEKGVILEEINMSEDTPEDILFDLLAESRYGDQGLGRTILGPKSNIKRFTRQDVLDYMDKYYTADNVVISIAGNVDIDKVEQMVDSYFAKNFVRTKSASQVKCETVTKNHLHKYKKIEQTHVGISLPAYKLGDERNDALSIASYVLGGGMSSRLFQKIREEMGLAYSVYSYISAYKDQGVLEVYAGVNPKSRDVATAKIIEEMQKLKDNGINEQEFLRGKEQIKSAFIMARESTSSQMLLFGKHMIYFDEKYSIEDKLKKFEKLTIEHVNKVIKDLFDFDKIATSTVGPKKTSLKI